MSESVFNSISPTRLEFNTIVQALRCGRPGCRCQREPANGQVVVHCPAHPDDEPSLSLAVTPDGQLLWKCFAGCSQETVLEAFRRRGLLPAGGSGSPGPAGLTVETLAEAKGLPAEFLRGLGLVDIKLQGRPAVVIPYYDRDGNESAVRYRLALQGAARFRWRRGSRVLPYGLDRLKEVRKAGWVILVEGESDTWVCWLNGVPALGVPGASTWHPAWADQLDGLKVYVWKEPDRGGDTLATAVLRDLPDALVIEPPAGVKDVCDLWLWTGRDPAKFKAELNALMARARPGTQIRAEALSAEARTLYERARPVLEDRAFLHRLVLATEILGHVGDRRSVAALHLALGTVRLKPAPVIIKGPASAGKNNLVAKTTTLWPPEAFVFRSGASERWLAYTNEEFKHRFIVLMEASALNTPFGAYLARTLISEGRLVYETVEKTADGLRPRLIEKEGPTGFVATTTKSMLEEELESRCWTIEVPDDPEYIRRAKREVARRHNGADPVPGAEIESLKAALEWLYRFGETEVTVPYAEWLADHIPDRLPKVLRLTDRLLTAIKASAWLHQRQRPRDGAGRIVATVADYAAVRAVFDKAFEVDLSGLTVRQREVLEALRAVWEEKPAPDHWVSARRVAKHLGKNPGTAAVHLKALFKKGYIIAKEGGRGWAYQPDPEVEPPKAEGLPAVEELAEAYPHLAESWVDPLTGDVRACALIPPEVASTFQHFNNSTLQPDAEEREVFEL
jgi:DNA-binding transcriptional ArsR family regulator